MSIKIAIVGATGIVGSVFLEILSESDLNIERVDAIASSSSIGTHASFRDKDIPIQDIVHYTFDDVDVVIFATSSEVSRVYVPKALKAGCFVIDKSTFYRLDESVPLVIPEVNGDHVDWKTTKLVANPNCMVTAIIMALKPLHNLSPLRRVVATTFQSVSGGGKKAMDELFQQTRSVLMSNEIKVEHFPKQIAFNLFPEISHFLSNGETEEEEKIVHESQKLLGFDLRITTTCVRVPVFIGHSASLNIEFEDHVALSHVRSALKSFPGILVIDKREEGGYITPQEASGENEVFVSRIREDLSQDNAINLWVLTDNLRKGAALNAFQILELIYEENFS